jgi:hypothetical protein
MTKGGVKVGPKFLSEKFFENGRVSVGFNFSLHLVSQQGLVVDKKLLGGARRRAW